jgi:hypothetical protein
MSSNKCSSLYFTQWHTHVHKIHIHFCTYERNVYDIRYCLFDQEYHLPVWPRIPSRPAENLPFWYQVFVVVCQNNVLRSWLYMENDVHGAYKTKHLLLRPYCITTLTPAVFQLCSPRRTIIVWMKRPQSALVARLFGPFYLVYVTQLFHDEVLFVMTAHMSWEYWCQLSSGIYNCSGSVRSAWSPGTTLRVSHVADNYIQAIISVPNFVLTRLILSQNWNDYMHLHTWIIITTRTTGHMEQWERTNLGQFRITEVTIKIIQSRSTC